MGNRVYCVSQFLQIEAEERFQRGSHTSIMCIFTLELGIDVGDLDLVFQANAPSTVSSFLQRLGRTGWRVGQRANTTFFCEDIETVLQAIAISYEEFEILIKRMIREGFLFLSSGLLSTG